MILAKYNRINAKEMNLLCQKNGFYMSKKWILYPMEMDSMWKENEFFMPKKWILYAMEMNSIC